MSQELKITEVNIIPVKPNDGLIGFVSFVLNDSFYVGSIGVYTKFGGRGFRLVYPTKKYGERNIGIFHPINARTSFLIEMAVYDKVMKLFDGIINENHEQLPGRPSREETR